MIRVTDEPSFARRASDAREAGRYETAGDYYTLAAHRRFARSEWNEYNVWWGPNYLLYAAICYLLADEPRYCDNRCEQGTLLARDLRARFGDEDAWRGLSYELEGDFGVISTGDGTDSYGAALEAYELLEKQTSLDEIIGWLSEEGFHWNVELLFRITDAVDESLDEETKAELRSRSPTARIEFKRDHYGRLVRSLLERGAWDCPSE